MTPEEEKKEARRKRRGKGKNFSLWLSPEQEVDLYQRANAVLAPSPSAFIKSRVFDKEIIPIRRIHTKAADPALIRQLSWIGNNVNQLARVANRSRELSPMAAVQIYAALSIIAEEMESLSEGHRNDSSRSG